MRKNVIQNMKSEIKVPGCISSLNQNQIKIIVSAKPGAKVSSISGSYFVCVLALVTHFTEISYDSVTIQIGAPPVYA